MWYANNFCSYRVWCNTILYFKIFSANFTIGYLQNNSITIRQDELNCGLYTTTRKWSNIRFSNVVIIDNQYFSIWVYLTSKSEGIRIHHLNIQILFSPPSDSITKLLENGERGVALPFYLWQWGEGLGWFEFPASSLLYRLPILNVATKVTLIVCWNFHMIWAKNEVAMPLTMK